MKRIARQLGWSASIAAAFAAVSWEAHAAPPPWARPTSPRAIEQGIEDDNLLMIGRVDMQEDLRIPIDFSRVYELGRDGDHRTLARRAGALWAVFEQSEYIPTSRGRQAVVPASTVFYLGEPPSIEPAAAAGRESQGITYVSTRVPLETPLQAEASQQADAATRAKSEPDRVIDLNLIEDDLYRAERVESLLLDAAENATGPAPSR